MKKRETNSDNDLCRKENFTFTFYRMFKDDY